MEPDYWHQRWQTGQIGFHLDQVNPLLVQYWSKTGAQPGETVFVPLCGKTLDMAWLRAQGFRIIGIELSEIAIRDFFREQGLSATRGEQDGMPFHEAEGIRLYCGDFFQLRARHLDACRRVYDRASLIALPPDMRRRYAGHMLSLLPAAWSILLITLTHEPDTGQGPPFSVKPEEVRQLYGRQADIQCLAEVDILPDSPRFAEQGLTALYERVYLMQQTA